jgi:hypothetical protein
MSCEELRDHFELFLMGVADSPERDGIREHLERGCEACRSELMRARSVNAALATLAPPAVPSPALRRRVLASAGAEERRFNWMPVLAFAAALSLAAAVYVGARERNFSRQAAGLREQVRRQATELARLDEALAILGARDTTVVSFGAGAPRPPAGKVFVNPSQGVLFIASNLPPVPAGKVYEMWLVPKAGAPARAGEFQPRSDGTAMHLRSGAFDRAQIAAVAVTVENEGGADRPTLPILIAAPLE